MTAAYGANADEQRRIPFRAKPHRLTRLVYVSRGRVTHPGEDVAGTRLIVRPTFNLDATVRVLQRRPTNRIDVWQPHRYLRVLMTADGPALVAVENRGTIDDPDARLHVRSGNPSVATRLELARTARRMLGLDVNPVPLQHRVESERRLRDTALALRGMRPPRFAEFFQTFARVVPFQQLSLDAGVAIVGRLVERFGKHVEFDGRRFYAFPAGRAVATADLSTLVECGRHAKAQSLRRVAVAIESGDLAEDAIAGMSTADALAKLTELRGIGAWSAAVVLLRGFGRLDVFPPGDVGAVRRPSALLRLRSRASLERVIERFGDRRGYLYFFGLGGDLLEKGVIARARLQSGIEKIG